MRCIKILVKGVLRGLGYLGYVYVVANKLGIRGWARYIDTGTVEIIGIGDDGVLEEFLYKLRYHETLAIVNEIHTKECPEVFHIDGKFIVEV